MGLIKPEWKLSPDVVEWSTIADKPWFERRMEVYAAMIDNMDRGIGRVVDQLKRTGQLDNTLILFLQDNGGCAEESGSKGAPKPDPAQPVVLRPMKPADLQTDMVPKTARDGRPVRQGQGVMPGPADTFVAYGKEWANVSNTPFREYKHWVHEGGISTPLIAHWPQGITRRGDLEHAPGHLIDIAATCYELAGAAYPAEQSGRAITPLEGVSLTPLFKGGSLPARVLYWEHEGNRAVRQGDWKLVAKGRNGPWELYNIAADRTEQNDLAAAEPAKVADLAALWLAYAQRTHVLPWPAGGEAKQDKKAAKARNGKSKIK
jgi:arylsulfatase